MVEASHTYVCASCKKEALGRYVAGGWWQFPLGWLVHDAADKWVCSKACARDLSRSDEVRRHSGEVSKVDPGKLGRDGGS
jgi:hypothetical protein